MFEYFPHVTAFAALDTLIILCFVPWVLTTKKDSTSAIAWCLVILAMPIGGALLFWVFGYNHIYPSLRRRQLHRFDFRRTHPPQRREAARGGEAEDWETWQDLGRLAVELKAFPVSHGNRVTLFADTQHAFDALLGAVQAARHHVHLEYYIVRTDGTGEELLQLLTEKARQGVEVRLLYDWLGGWTVRRRLLRPLLEAGGRISSLLPITRLRSRLQINLRNHRKIAVVDGHTAFTGGMNIGDEYLGKKPSVGYWRDTVLRLEGPAVAGLQRIFTEDWDFAYGEALNGPAYFPDLPDVGNTAVQVVESGPDQERNTIRELYFAALTSARKRVWLATPYTVPDSGLLDALLLARHRGVDVRILTILRPDHFLSFHAGHYYWNDMLKAGIRLYQYAKGMMHSKFLLADGQWGLVGSANLDNRSMHLNFEAGCVIHAPELVTELEESFEQDLQNSIPVDPAVFARRSYRAHLLENACRLLSPVL